MIDTVKIFTKINKDIYNIIENKSIIKTSFSKDTGEIFYNIVNDHLKGSFDTSLSVRIDTGEKYGFDKDFIITIEGSCHKIVFGQNAYNGFYDLDLVVLYLKSLVENAYNIKLPDYKYWYLKRIDIAKCFDLKNQDRVINYINNLKLIEYPRRNPKHDKNNGIYFPGTTTTLKIYNKLREFKKNDRLKLKDKKDFNIFEFEKKIKGFCRFEVEIKNKKLKDIFEKKYQAKMTNIPCYYFNYELFENVWNDEFMKILKLNYSDLQKVSEKNSVKNRLNNVYGSTYGFNLYQFYLNLVVDGCKAVRDSMSKTTYYRKIKDLKEAGVDFCSNQISIVYSNKSDFVDIFTMKEVI